jgi:hypothetical protein
MEKFYGGNAKYPSTTAAWRTARAEVTIGGQTIQVPLVDIGPGKGPRARGVVIDLTDHLANGMGMGDESPAQIRLLPPNTGPD